jgi:hypothetical protein
MQRRSNLGTPQAIEKENRQKTYANHISMKTFEQNLRTSPGGRVAPVCFVCQKPLANGQWCWPLDAQSKFGADSDPAELLLCSPSCAYRYFAFSEIGISQI